MIIASEYEERRNKLLDKLEEGTLVILFSGVSIKSSADATYDFETNRNFYYLTGIRQENSILMLLKGYSENHIFLFVDEKDERKEKWTGLKLSIEEAQDISGIANVLLRSSFDGKLNTILSINNPLYGRIKMICLDLEDGLVIDANKTTKDYALEIKEKYNDIEIFDIYKDIAALRMIKSKAEILMVKEAIKTTELGLNHVLRTLEAGRYEYNLRNIFEYIIKEDSQSGIAFPTIVASGKNGVILHYPNAVDRLNENELVLLDCGASKDLYCADISRTYPISGRYSAIQKTIYQIVLDCNKETINFIRPGVRIQEVKDFAKNFLADECLAKGLIKTKEEISRVYYHGCSHHLGLDTHDVSDTLDKPLEEGNIITCEPGLYFKEYNVGVRIEDDILITKNGSECLSKDIIKEIKDIEKLLSYKF